MLAEMTPTRATCAKCGAGDLEHFYTFKRNGKTLCTDCFQHRVEQARPVTPIPFNSIASSPKGA